jgi:hypothetical protein
MPGVLATSATHRGDHRGGAQRPEEDDDGEEGGFIVSL